MRILLSLGCVESLQVGGLLSIIFILILVFLLYSGVRWPVEIEERSRAVRSQRGSFRSVSPMLVFWSLLYVFSFCKFKSSFEIFENYTSLSSVLILLNFHFYLFTFIFSLCLFSILSFGSRIEF